MTRAFADSVLERTDTTGTGVLSLAGAVTGYRRFRVAHATGAHVAYVLQQATYTGEILSALAREIGIGTIRHGNPDTLSRDVILSQHGGDAVQGKLNLAAGGADVYGATPAALSGAAARAVNAATQLDGTDLTSTILATGGAGGITVTLPDGADLPPGVWVRLVKVDAGDGAVMVAGHGAEQINGAGTYALPTQWDQALLVWTGAEWTVREKPPAATAASSGLVELLTAAEMEIGTDSTRAMTAAAYHGTRASIGAWMAIDGTGVVSARDDFNCSSVLDVDIGTYNMHIDSDMATNYHAQVSASVGDVFFVSPGTFSPSGLTARVRNGSGGKVDQDPVFLAAIGPWA